MSVSRMRIPLCIYYILLCHLFLLQQARVYLSASQSTITCYEINSHRKRTATHILGVEVYASIILGLTVSSHLPCPLFLPLVSAPQLYTEPPASPILISGTSQCLTCTCHNAWHIIQKTLHAIQYILTLPVSGPALTSLSPFLSPPLGISSPSCSCQKWLSLVPLSAHSPSAPVSPLPQPAQSD